MYKVVELWCEQPHGDLWEKVVKTDLTQSKAEALAAKLNEKQDLESEQIRSYVVRPAAEKSVSVIAL